MSYFNKKKLKKIKIQSYDFKIDCDNNQTDIPIPLN